MALFDDLFGKDKKKGQKAYGLFTFMNEEKSDDNVNGYSDEEMDAYDLTDRQKEEVKNGNYDPWSFEEEDLEEEDYFYEDDD